MTATETKLIHALCTVGYFIVIPDSMDHKTARKLCRQFGLIERETMAGGVVVYMYRINTEGFSPIMFINGSR